MKTSKLSVLAVVLAFITLTMASCGKSGNSSPAVDYSIGGTVTGLVGTLVLQNNGADDLTLAADGVFTFASMVADGSAYAVSVKTQPAGATCTVNNGTGVVAGANITNVIITCSSQSFSIGGTVSGLTGTLVLQNNSADDLLFTVNGAFTFTTKVADGAGYAVTIKTQPAAAACAVTNGSGVVSGANVTSVTVICTVAAYSTIKGSVFAASVNGASVIVKNAGNNTIAGPVSTAADGSYSIDVLTSDLTGNLRFIATGGTFVDEATGLTTAAGPLAAYVEGGMLTTGSAVHLDPSSTILHTIVTAGSGTSFAGAKALFSSAFGYIPDTAVAPMNTAPAGSNAPNRLAALRAAAFSQMAKNMDITPGQQFDLMTAIAHDLADDGTLNGSAAPVNGATLSEDIQNKFESALVSFMSNTLCNHTGLTTSEIGSLPFGKVVLTNSYRFEYLPGMMAATQGKTSFKIKVTNRSNGSAATGLSLTLMPMMHMPTMGHSTPVDTVTESSTPGTYNCTAYYLMASGPGMGYWELKVMTGGMMGETATFYPAVGMAMGTTTGRASLKGQADLILSSSTGTATEKRTYYLFNDGLTSSMSSYTFKLFIATKESMMSYPAIGTGTALKNDQKASWNVNPITVDASTDKTTWLPATEGTAGHWSIAGLTGLSSGQTGTIYVKVSVNSEAKTTDGLAPMGTNDYAKFTVTPGGM